ncbi:MAG: hypothetical protein AVDCRST_MAG19-4403, partial [uncultured Thermomicrobiales bacterium]
GLSLFHLRVPALARRHASDARRRLVPGRPRGAGHRRRCRGVRCDACAGPCPGGGPGPPGRRQRHDRRLPRRPARCPRGRRDGPRLVPARRPGASGSGRGRRGDRRSPGRGSRADDDRRPDGPRSAVAGRSRRRHLAGPTRYRRPACRDRVGGRARSPRVATMGAGVLGGALTPGGSCVDPPSHRSGPVRRDPAGHDAPAGRPARSV